MTPIGVCTITSLLFICSLAGFLTGHWAVGLGCLTLVGVLALIVYLIWGRDDQP